ncbi:hypothetical protein SAVIM40S_03444 [Streptomyces avidinii]
MNPPTLPHQASAPDAEGPPPPTAEDRRHVVKRRWITAIIILLLVGVPAGFPKNKGMRIDLVYGNEAFAKAVTDSYVDREERKGKGASDHAPVVVDLDLG